MPDPGSSTIPTIPITIHVPDEPRALGDRQRSPRLTVTVEDGLATFTVGEVHEATRDDFTEAEWQRRRLVWTNTLAPGTLAVSDRARVEALAADLAPLLARAVAGHRVEWDGSNTSGTLNDDAAAAAREIAEHVADAEWWSEEWAPAYASEWLYAGETVEGAASSLGITASTTDADLAAIAATLTACAERDRVVLVGDVLDELREIRGRLDEAA